MDAGDEHGGTGRHFVGAVDPPAHFLKVRGAGGGGGGQCPHLTRPHRTSQVMSSEVEETLKRINSHKGVKGVLIMNSEGIPIRSNLSDEDTENYSALVSQLAIKAHHVVRTLDEGDELAFLRVRSKKHEIMIAPDKEYILVVIQNPSDTGSH